MSNVTPVVLAVLAAEFVPAAAFGFATERVLLPALCVVPYVVPAF